MRRHAYGQRGQAMVEALLMLPVLVLVFLGVAWMGKAQYTALALMQASRQTAMSVALGLPVAPAEGIRIQQAADIGDGGWRAGWWGGDARRVWATSQAWVSGTAVWGGFQLARRVGVAAGAGNARDDEDAQRRIGLSTTGWGRVAAGSASLAQMLAPVVEAVDRPWRRPSPSRDWLSAWGDVLPADNGVNDRRTSP